MPIPNIIHALRPRIGKEIKGVGVLYLLSPKKISFSIENEKSLYKQYSNKEFIEYITKFKKMPHDTEDTVSYYEEWEFDRLGGESDKK